MSAIEINGRREVNKSRNEESKLARSTATQKICKATPGLEPPPPPPHIPGSCHAPLDATLSMLCGMFVNLPSFLSKVTAGSAFVMDKKIKEMYF